MYRVLKNLNELREVRRALDAGGHPAFKVLVQLNKYESEKVALHLVGS